MSTALAPSAGDASPARASTPSLLGTLVRHEWHLLRADRMLRVVAALFGALLLIALVNGVAWTRFQSATLSSLRQADDAGMREYVDSLGKLNASSPLASWPPDPRTPVTLGQRTGTLAALEPAPLAALAVGQSDLLPYYFRVTTSGRQNVLKGDEIENPTNLLTGRFDLAFVIVVLFPLVILALSYNMLSGEREDGTLAQVLSQPVRLRDVLLAKVGVRAALVLGLAFALVAAGLLAARVNPGEAGVIVTALLWFVVVASYAAFWFGVALVVNATVRGSAASAVVSVSAWLLLVVLAPVLVNLIAQHQHPTPSRVAFISTARTVTNEANTVADRLLSKYFFDHPNLVTGVRVDMDDVYARSISVQDTIEKTLAPYYAQFDRELAQQQAVIDAARVVTPALLTQTALEDLAGTGLPRWQRFRAQTLYFHAQWQQYFLPRQLRKQQLSAIDVKGAPVFRYEEELVGAVQWRVAAGLLWLLLPTAGLWWFAFARFRTYRVAG